MKKHKNYGNNTALEIAWFILAGTLICLPVIAQALS
jgi:hypothetical protein